LETHRISLIFLLKLILPFSGNLRVGKNIVRKKIGLSMRSVAFLEFVIFILILPLNSWGQERVKIALWGDSRENKDNACENIADILLHKITDWDFQIHTGDFTSHGSEEDWQGSLNDLHIPLYFNQVRILLIHSTRPRRFSIPCRRPHIPL